MARFNSISEVKAACEFFPKGRIIPQRILHVSKRAYRGRKFFGADSWAIPTPAGYLILCDTAKGESAIRIRGMKNCALSGSPYVSGGGTRWIGNYELSDAKWLESFEAAYKEAFK